ncbi:MULTISPECIES: peroxiredoxin [Ensifer]|jgi:peroxiredoxin Q/BCP|uniref:thioredoxin-dependent peroxiredoxin n=1 Tax=Ensifer canadensis TaxID=555315 RepID=A0AAW4FPL8_9HYPH|nr:MULTISPECIES: peroxiredoxin [Ensifer]AHK44441.1 bacterioferritin comigratory protein [Ensifer adhaerens OV14]KQU85957.1 bacterioferritin [Ensifer sp. Root31]KQW58963.1 bacterioferritin [Ensifer sp. Root1252]KQW74668.1 bacterioferritin [Ensifer sp. Root127]KQY61923.1 bacterioferritin [Ensifer sp. Root142]
MASLTPGDLAPDFTLPRDGGGTISLSALRGRPVVLFFYPKDDTKSCTLEAISFTELASEFAAAGVELIGLSPDSVKRHDRFAKKYDLAVTLAADEERSVVNAYGLWVEKSLYGRKYMGVERTTFLIAADGRIARVWEKVKVNGHANEVLEAAKAL